MENKKQTGKPKPAEDNKQGSGANEKDIHGRLYNSKNPAFKDEDSKDDISQVDQQEGTMNRGTTGGEGV